MSAFAQQLIYGTSYGMNLAVAAAGLALLFGVYRVINLAHGQLIMFGGYIAYVVTTGLGLHFFVGFAAAMVAMGVAGVILEISVFRILQRRPATDQLLASLGVYMMIGILALRIWGDFEARPINMPGEEGAILLGEDIRIDFARIVTIAITIAVFAVLYFVVYRTHLGRTMRATAQGPETATLMGIRKREVAALVFFIAGALGGAAGAMLGGLFNVRPDMGFQPLLMALIIIIFGGMGSLIGAIIAGLVLGILYNLTVFYVGSKLGDLVPFAVLLIILMVRPQGLFGLPGRRA
ncbi:MAG: branched-chain amino acid ABC transporter permease [Alphaproteobacteria bacterium]|nr:branched-chain amino acid ABC transporter permease [Alphaproteobacteria bacterium]